MNEKKTVEETEGYGALGVLSKREADLEKVYDELINVGTLHGIKILSRFAAQETAALREENERLKEAVKVAHFALNNCKTYLEVFKNEWKEGEEVLYYEIENAKKLTGK